MEHLPKKIHQNGISYTLVGDYYLSLRHICGTAPQGRRPTGPAGTGQAPRPGAGAVKGTVFCRPLYEKLSTFTHGKEIAL